MAKYSVVAFASDGNGPSAQADFLNKIMIGAIAARVPEKTPLGSSVEILVYPNGGIRSVEKYNDYFGVYFLNEAAVNLCGHLGLNLPATDEIDTPPGECGTYIRFYCLF